MYLEYMDYAIRLCSLPVELSLTSRTL